MLGEPQAPHAALLAEMQDVLRSLVPEQIVHVPVDERQRTVRTVRDSERAIVMRLGINVPNFGPGTTPASLRAWIEFAEETGFSLAMMSDHVAPTPDVTALYPAPFYDPFATLSWLAAFTTRLSLGTSVAIVPYRHPLLTARLSANLDQFTAGRFVLGVGVGWSETEFAALGVPFAERGRITDEFLAVITRAWAESEPLLRGRPCPLPGRRHRPGTSPSVASPAVDRRVG